MTRLTYQDKDGGVYLPWERNSANGSYDIWDEDGLIQQINRLAAYEDTGLTPEEIERVVDAYGRGHTLRTESAERLEIVREIKTDRLRELAKAEKNGRLEVLPCKVGDHILADGREAIVVWFFGYKTGRYLHAQFLDNAECADIPFYEIGKNRLPDP